MRQSTSFIYETDEYLKQRLKVVIPLIIVSILIVLFLNFSPWGQNITSIEPPTLASLDEYAPDPVNIFLVGFFGGLFFFPLPQEAFYFVAIKNGGAWLPLLIGVMGGFVLANVVNYIIGWKLNSVLVHLISSKKLFGIRRWVSKYGGWAVFTLNALPTPSPLLTFALGMVRYNIERLFILLTLGNLLKFLVIVLILA